MKIYSIREKNYEGKKVFLRVDFNVPIKNGVITDDTRITSTIPTIDYLLSHRARLIIASHLGRPEGKVSPEFSLKPVAERLSEILKKEVKFAPDCIGDEVKKLVNSLKEGEILLLENLRFHSEEEKGDENFAKELASLCDAYVNDAFGTCHRKHSSVYTITKFVNDVAAGFLIEKEVSALSKLLINPERPFLLILGGAKVIDKINMLKNLLDKVDTIITGGVMAYTFIKAKNWEVGDSKVEEEAIPVAKEIIKEINKRHLEFHTPLDHIIAQKISEDATFIATERGTVPHGWIGVDIGPQAIEEYIDCINRAKTIFWNGPMGIYEIEKFAKGTIEIAKAIAKTNAFSVIGGGDSVAIVQKAGVADKISHICTGGGASLEFLEKGSLPGIDVLKKE
ncbi:MAG: phosphoglycerate kinase [Candidatus Omnitrophica bacterium]|nr:phosphoglycerate kinase [Candidatus Omnitrophota bacterium]MCM8809288.1 phosphoglycerate kinase [Candidatus Omnitrophota bacterium]MCM8811013.1 phosphoglycerate kinase [Candidatus Omnitrophota bacterium]